MLEIKKYANENNYYTFNILTDEGKFEISYQNNLDLYWRYIPENPQPNHLYNNELLLYAPIFSSIEKASNFQIEQLEDSFKITFKKVKHKKIVECIFQHIQFVLETLVVDTTHIILPL